MSTAIVKLADSVGVSTQEMTNVVKGMIIASKGQHGAVATDAELTIVAGICSQHGLNPLTKEAHAFVSGGKLNVVIGIDGYIKVMNRHPDFDGVEFEDHFDGKELVSVTTKIHVKGRKFPTCATEYMDECFQPKSDAWRKYKKRMLRNKSLAQCVRIAFGITEVIDSDEAERIKDSEPTQEQQQERDVTPKEDSPIDYDFEMAECGDLDSLKHLCSGIRAALEASGKWNSRKSEIIALNTKHKDRINSYSDVEEAEFEEVSEDDEYADIVINEAPDIGLEDIPFGDSEEEF
ncbi:hypothetical protein MYOV065v1_p0003 [Vibrio phage PS15B.2]|nr:hypothetical protein MYOV065v1_p0003 [Vibrio phage PS15B.2]QZI90784.1 hypothetical protein MYOV066v1_p0006 [Vibrio phage PS15B.3]QZI90853.1 hypothetical protein MYOV064v1_p0003 [Vibrio phage PS15B.4]